MHNAHCRHWQGPVENSVIHLVIVNENAESIDKAPNLLALSVQEAHARDLLARVDAPHDV